MNLFPLPELYTGRLYTSDWPRVLELRRVVGSDHPPPMMAGGILARCRIPV